MSLINWWGWENKRDHRLLDDKYKATGKLKRENRRENREVHTWLVSFCALTSGQIMKLLVK